MKAERQLERLVSMARTDADVLAVILVGSRARGEQHAGSDVDVCPVSTPHERDAARSLLRRRVLKDGQVLFVRDEEALYDVAFATVRVFEAFRPRYEAYLAEVARDRP